MKLRKKILLMITAIIATTLVALGVYVTSAFNFSTNELAKTFKDYNTSDSEAIKQTKPISILLMGVDTGDSERKSTWQGNSDSMILVTINPETKTTTIDRKSTRLNSSHVSISYAVFCLKKKKTADAC